MIKHTIFVIISLIFINTVHTQEGGTAEIIGDVGAYSFPLIAFGKTLIEKDYEGTKQMGYAFAVNQLATFSLKRIINKERPNGGKYSFPSGHTSTAFQSATFLHLRYGKKIGIPAYLVASYVGWSRVNANVHDWYDVSAGAILGVLSSYLFTKNKNLQIDPVAPNTEVGLTIRYTF